MSFKEFYGDGWEDHVEKRFKDWALAIIGGVFPRDVMRGHPLTSSSEKHTSRRSLFLLSDASVDGKKAQTTASHPQPSSSTAVGELTEYPSTIDAITVEESEITGESTSSLLPQVSTPTRAVPPQTPSLTDRPSAATSQSLGSNPTGSAPPQVFETPGFIVPQVFPLPQSLEPAKSYSFNVPPIVIAPPVITPTATGSPQPFTPNQVAISTVHEADHPVAPPPGRIQIQQVTPDQTAIFPVVREPRFIVPQEIFPPPRSLEPTKNYHINVPPTVTESPATTQTVPGPSQPVAPNQVVVSPVAHDLGRLVAPVLESSQTITPSQAAVSPVVHEPSLLVTPVLEPTQVVAPNRTLNSAAVHDSPRLVTPFPILESCQLVTTNQVTVSPLVDPSTILGSSQAVAPQQVVVSPKPVSPPQAIDPHVIHTPQPAVAHGSSDLTGGVAGDSSGVTVATKSTYRSRDGVGVVDPNRPRRSSIEGAPDVMLSLCGSGYQLIDPSSQRDMSIYTPPHTAPSPTTPSSALPPDELTVPSSQQSLEESPTIPMEVETVIPTSPSPSAGELIGPSPQRPVKGPPTTSAASEITTTPSGRYRFAPRVIPTYNID